MNGNRFKAAPRFGARGRLHQKRSVSPSLEPRTRTRQGAPGIRKSRLLEEARGRATDLGLRVLSARGTELERGFPFGIVRQLFERLLLEAEAEEQGRWLDGAAALAADVVTAPTSVSGSLPPGLSLSDPAYAWQHGLYWLASNIATGADSLTPSERRVAELAADGGTNREIAQALFVTEKTVETHLGRAFRKLNINCRRQLPDVLLAAAS